jgi:hypothetical protein
VTTIVVKGGRMASDSRLTVSSEEGGDRVFNVKKIFRTRHGNVVGTSGENGPGLVFLQWAEDLGSDGIHVVYDKDYAPPRPEILDSQEVEDFQALVLTAGGQLISYDKFFVPETIYLEANFGFYAIGSGAKAALGALHANSGLTAKQAVIIASLVDPWTAGPFVEMTPGVAEDLI